MRLKWALPVGRTMLKVTVCLTDTNPASAGYVNEQCEGARKAIVTFAIGC